MVYMPERNYGCRISSDGTIRGMRTTVLENQLVRITVLPDKGTDIFEFLYKPLDVDFMWRSPMGLRNPTTFVPSSATADGAWFDYWEGGWQEVLPNGGVASSYKGASWGLHGETSLIPWDVRVLEDYPERVTVAFWVRLYRSPFYLEKTLSLEQDSGVLTIAETLINEGRERMAFMWGHHPTFGEAFLDEHCVIDTGARTVHNMPEIFFERQRFLPGDQFEWPTGKTRDGGRASVDRVPPADNNTADMLYLTDFDEAWYAVTNQKRQVGFGMSWSKEVFPYLWLFQTCRGWTDYPLYSRSHAMALEPFTSKPNAGISGALDDGSAVYLEPGAALHSVMRAVAYGGGGRVKRITQEGKVLWK